MVHEDMDEWSAGGVGNLVRPQGPLDMHVSPSGTWNPCPSAPHPSRAGFTSKPFLSQAMYLTLGSL